MTGHPLHSYETLHPLHRLWRKLPHKQRRVLFTSVTALLAAKPDPAPHACAGGVVIVGEITRASGLGEGARLMAQALDMLGVPNCSIDSRIGVPGEAPDLPSSSGADLAALSAPLVIHVNAPQMPAAMMRLGRQMLGHRKVIGYWAWELPELPEAWNLGFRFVHEIWVPSSFTADAVSSRLRSIGRSLPVRVVSHPLSGMPMRVSRLDRAAFGLPENAVIVMTSFNLASSFERKNPLGAIFAFQEAFAGRRDILLLIKTGKSDHYGKDMERIRAAIAGAENIRIETRTFSTEDNLALLSCCDIVLSLHRSEGFGLVLAEAMVLGKPVVATGWSGNMDFMDADSACMVDYKLIEVTDSRGTYDVPKAVWADPERAVAVAHLRNLASNAALRASIGASARAKAQASLGVGKLGEAVRSLGLDFPTV